MLERGQRNGLEIMVMAGSLLRSGILFMEMLHEKICLALSLLLYRPCQYHCAVTVEAELPTVEVHQSHVGTADDAGLRHDEPESASPASDYT